MKFMIHEQDGGQMSLLHEAASVDDVDLLQSGVKQGLNVNEVDPDWGGRTPLHVACSLGHADCVEALVKLGADVNSRRDSDLWTPLHCSAERGQLDCVKLLLDAGAVANSVDKYGDAAMRVAEVYGHQHVIRLLKTHENQQLCGCGSDELHKDSKVMGEERSALHKSSSAELDPKPWLLQTNCEGKCPDSK